MAVKSPPIRRGRILFSILALLFLVGVVPLVWTSIELVARSRQSLESNQKEWQLDKARLISTQVSIYVDGLRTQVASIARTLEVDPGAGGFKSRLARIGAQRGLDRYLKDSASLVYVSVVDATGVRRRSRGSTCAGTQGSRSSSPRPFSADSTASRCSPCRSSRSRSRSRWWSSASRS